MTQPYRGDDPISLLDKRVDDQEVRMDAWDARLTSFEGHMQYKVTEAEKERSVARYVALTIGLALGLGTIAYVMTLYADVQKAKFAAPAPSLTASSVQVNIR